VLLHQGKGEGIWTSNEYHSKIITCIIVK